MQKPITFTITQKVWSAYYRKKTVYITQSNENKLTVLFVFGLHIYYLMVNQWAKKVWIS
jgi:hypothetical protein